MVIFKLALISAESVLPDRPFDNFRTSNLSIHVFILEKLIQSSERQVGRKSFFSSA